MSLARDFELEARVRERLVESSDARPLILKRRFATGEEGPCLREGPLSAGAMPLQLQVEGFKGGRLGLECAPFSIPQPLRRVVPRWPIAQATLICGGETPELGEEGHGVGGKSSEWRFGDGESGAELPIPVIYIGGDRVRGPAAEELPHPLHGRPSTGAEDSVGRLPHADAAGFWFRGGFWRVEHEFRWRSRYGLRGRQRPVVSLRTSAES
jgi:hypothetical protein